MQQQVCESSRKRSPNFTKKENKVLAELIQLYEEQIEIRKTDHASNRLKGRAWQELTRDFNARTGGVPYRSVSVLRHRYENIKKGLRRNIRKNNSVGSNPTQIEIIQLKNISDYLLADSNNTDYEEDEPDVEDMDIKEIVHVKLTEEASIDHNDFDIYTDSNKHAQKHTNIDILKENEMDSTFLLNSEMIDLQKKCFLEEHKLKLQHMREKHTLELESIRQEHKERIKLLRQEHDIRMEMLDLEKSVSIINKI